MSATLPGIYGSKRAALTYLSVAFLVWVGLILAVAMVIVTIRHTPHTMDGPTCEQYLQVWHDAGITPADEAVALVC